MPPDNPFGSLVITTWRDLQRKYVRDKPTIHSTWLSLSPAQRKAVILAGVNGGEEGFLRHKDDAKLGNVRHIIPELNMQDLVSGARALEFLDRRATASVMEMYPYDAHAMRTSMRVNGVSHATGRVAGAVMMFMEEDQYGACMELGANARGNEMNVLLSMGNGCILNENEGLMVLERQARLYSFLSILVDDIMDARRTLDDPDAAKRLPKRKKAVLGSKEEIEQTLRRLEVPGGSRKSKSVATKISLKGAFDRLAQDSQEQYLSTDDHVNLVREEPLYFSHVANDYFFSSPGMVPNEEGVQETIYSGEVATRSTLDLLRDAYQAAAFWKYISALSSELARGQHTSEKLRNPLTDELWATCNQELLRARGVYRRFVQAELKYSKYFVRNTSDRGSSRPMVQLKGTLEAVTKKTQFVSWILQLAAETEHSDGEVARLLKSLDEFQETVVKARELISERMGDALADIAVIVAFMARLRQVIVVPEHAGSSAFESKVAARAAEMETACSGLDLADYVFPVDNLREPAACRDCFGGIDARLSGSSLAVDLAGVFQEAIEQSVLEIIGKLAESGVAGQQSSKDVPFDPFINQTEETKTTYPKPKKTHGTTASASISKVAKYFPARAAPPEVVPIPAPPTALKTFRKIFRQDHAARVGIPWSAFVAAMTSIGFTVEPIGGSVMRFRPPGSADRPISFHRPHPTDKLEGWTLLRLVKRLERTFGWSAATFVAAKRG